MEAFAQLAGTITLWGFAIAVVCGMVFISATGVYGFCTTLKNKGSFSDLVFALVIIVAPFWFAISFYGITLITEKQEQSVNVKIGEGTWEKR